jgi:hypothetical protein
MVVFEENDRVIHVGRRPRNWPPHPGH